jgi:MraZ protein
MAINAPSQRMWGRYEHSLDDKGRVIVPQKFRDKLGEEFVLTIGPGNHIRIYPMNVWENLEEQLVSVSVHDELDPNLVFLQRMFGNCEFTRPDKENRISIPRHLRDWATVRESEPAIIVGSGTRLEIWNRTVWDNYSKEAFTEERAARASGNRQIREGFPAPAAVTAPVELRGDSVPTADA